MGTAEAVLTANLNATVRLDRPHHPLGPNPARISLGRVKSLADLPQVRLPQGRELHEPKLAGRIQLETRDKTIRTTCPRRAVGMAPSVLSCALNIEKGVVRL